MSQDITVTDLFCGAGGSSIGVEAAGARLVMAANHWRLAIDTHNTNFPNANHDCADISQVKPGRYPRTDILIASPECTNHSSAKTRKRTATIWDPAGGDEEERSRATMWDVVRFSEFHRYDMVIVENVVEARRWLPFQDWLGAMRSLGYDSRAVYMNSMIAHPTPQSRDRMYVVFWLRGNPAPDLEFRPIAWCATCERDVEAIQTWKRPDRPWGKYRSQYTYRCPSCASVALPYAWPAAAAIDWSLPAPRIGDRDRPLADATMRRIRAGLDRYGANAIIQAAGHTFERPGYYRTWPVWEPLGTQTATAQHALVVDTAFTGRERPARPSQEPLTVQTGRQSQALVVTMRGTSPEALKATALPAVAPLGPVTAGGPHHALLVRHFGIKGGDASRFAHPVDAPAGAITASGNLSLLVPAGGTWNDEARPTDEPFRTRTAREAEGLVVRMTEHGQAVPAAAAPLSTQVATSAIDGLIVPLRTHGQAEPAHVSPVPTVVAGNAGHALLIRQYGGGAEMAKPIEAPAGTITTVDHHALLQPSLDVEDCGFRMLEPHEIGRAMAFDDSYVVLGNKRERVRQYGNAVTPPVMSMLIDRAIASLASGRGAS